MTPATITHTTLAFAFSNFIFQMIVAIFTKKLDFTSAVKISFFQAALGFYLAHNAIPHAP